jgi:hypothetical protein
VEFCASDVGSLDANQFVREFDQALATTNIEYAGKRESRRLGAPRLYVMLPQWSDRIASADFRDGKREAQYKWRQLVQEWDERSRGEIFRTSTL